MKKITVKNLIQFRGKKEKSKLTFINNLKKEKKKSENGDEGGDYWISALSAVRNTFKFNDERLLDEKIEELNEKIKLKELKRIKDQYARNIDLLNTFRDLNKEVLKPKSELKFLKQPKEKSILQINGLPIEAKPCHIYSFSENKSEEVGGIWFVAVLNGYKKTELGMFAEIMYRYLHINFSKDYFVNSKFCIVVDLATGQEVCYEEVQNGSLPSLIEVTINDLKNLLS